VKLYDAIFIKLMMDANDNKRTRAIPTVPQLL
jgi:hypothetical protein